MNSNKTPFLRSIIEKLTLVLPYFIVLGILDYRFHFFYYNYLNRIRPLTGNAFFDFFSIYDLYIWAVALLLLCAFASDIKKNSTILKAWLRNPFLAVSCVLFLAGGITAVVSYAPVAPILHSFISYVNTNYFTPFLTALLLLYALTSKIKMTQFFKHFIFAFSLLGSLTLFEYATDLLPGPSHDFLNRAVWPYIDPFVLNKPESANWLSYLFAPLFLCSIYYLFDRDTHTYSDRILYIVGALIGSSVIVASQSYAGLGAAAIIAFGYLFKKIPTRKQKIGLIVMATTLITVFIYSQKDSRKMQILFGNYKKENSLERRAQIYTETISLLRENPFTGIGMGNFQSAFREGMGTYLEKPIPEDEVPPHPHNVILHFWGELGIFGLIFMICMYCYTALSWCRKTLTNPGYLGLGYILIHGIADVPFGLQEASTMFFILWATVVIFHRQYSETSIDDAR